MKATQMMGSYSPRNEAWEWRSEEEEAPSGKLHHDKYTIKSKFTDDDGFDHKTWEWAVHIKSKWEHI